MFGARFPPRRADSTPEFIANSRAILVDRGSQGTRFHLPLGGKDHDKNRGVILAQRETDTMTVNEIEKAQKREDIKFETATAIRSLLDSARGKYGTERWDDNDTEGEILKMVTDGYDE